MIHAQVMIFTVCLLHVFFPSPKAWGCVFWGKSMSEKKPFHCLYVCYMSSSHPPKREDVCFEANEWVKKSRFTVCLSATCLLPIPQSVRMCVLRQMNEWKKAICTSMWFSSAFHLTYLGKEECVKLFKQCSVKLCQCPKVFYFRSSPPMAPVPTTVPMSPSSAYRWGKKEEERSGL